MDHRTAEQSVERPRARCPPSSSLPRDISLHGSERFESPFSSLPPHCLIFAPPPFLLLLPPLSVSLSIEVYVHLHY
jgi:hypothetical protein